MRRNAATRHRKGETMTLPICNLAARSAAMTAAAGLAISPVLAETNAVGINAAVRNKVEIRSAATNKLHPAVLRQQVILNDEIRTAAASSLQILLLDKSTFTVGANARVAIDHFVYDPTANSRSTEISVMRGAFRFMSGRKFGHPSGSATVRTPVAVIGIRGTIFEGVVGEAAVAISQQEQAVGKVKSDKHEASLIILRGPGPKTQGDALPGAIDVTAGGKTITLDGPGLAVYVPRAGAVPIGPFRISSDGLQNLQTLMRPVPGQVGNNAARDALMRFGISALGGLLGGRKANSPDPSPQSSDFPGSTVNRKVPGQ